MGLEVAVGGGPTEPLEMRLQDSNAGVVRLSRGVMACVTCCPWSVLSHAVSVRNVLLNNS